MMAGPVVVGAQRRRGVGAFLMAAAMMLAVAVVPTLHPAQAAVGGPVILGGDDLTDHGSFDSTNNQNEEGWLYLQKALENIKPRVTRANDNSVAALGSGPSTSTAGNAGAAIGRAATAAGLTVTYHNGGPAIAQFFADLQAGTAKPAIIWIAGDGATNDLGDSSGEEAQALIANATAIADFVNSGGGLMSHGSEYGWLSALLPGASAVLSGGSSDLVLTPEGQAAFPGLTDPDVNAGPWHNHFEGNLGGLAVLVRSTSVTDAAGNPAPVVIGGAAVQLPGSIVLDPPTATNAEGTPHTVTATLRGNAGALLPGATVTFTVTAGPNTGRTGSGVTDVNGQATFTYTGTGGTGTDTISASFTDAGGIVRSTTATKTWGAGTTSTTTSSTSTTSSTTSTTAAPIVPTTGGGMGTGGVGTGGAGIGTGGTGTGGSAIGTGGSATGGTATGGDASVGGVTATGPTVVIGGVTVAGASPHTGTVPVQQQQQQQQQTQTVQTGVLARTGTAAGSLLMWAGVALLIGITLRYGSDGVRRSALLAPVPAPAVFRPVRTRLAEIRPATGSRLDPAAAEALADIDAASRYEAPDPGLENPVRSFLRSRRRPW